MTTPMTPLPPSTTTNTRFADNLDLCHPSLLPWTPPTGAASSRSPPRLAAASATTHDTRRHDAGVMGEASTSGMRGGAWAGRFEASNHYSRNLPSSMQTLLSTVQGADVMSGATYLEEDNNQGRCRGPRGCSSRRVCFARTLHHAYRHVS